MKIISHRGNIDGRDPSNENDPNFIDSAINLGFDVELDLWSINDKLYLGHDYPDKPIEIGWLLNRKNKIWVHSKNIESLSLLYNTDLNFFWHESDKTTMTSKKFFWSLPGVYLKNGITVEASYKKINSDILGICTDYPILYQNEKNNNF